MASANSLRAVFIPVPHAVWLWSVRSVKVATSAKHAVPFSKRWCVEKFIPQKQKNRKAIWRGQIAIVEPCHSFHHVRVGSVKIRMRFKKNAKECGEADNIEGTVSLFKPICAPDLPHSNQRQIQCRKVQRDCTNLVLSVFSHERAHKGDVQLESSFELGPATAKKNCLKILECQVGDSPPTQ